MKCPNCGVRHAGGNCQDFEGDEDFGKLAVLASAREAQVVGL